MMEEYNSIMKNDVWAIVLRLEGNMDGRDPGESLRSSMLRMEA
jgi:hypothetical protein